MFDDFETFLRILAEPSHADYQKAWRYFDNPSSPYRRAILGKIQRFTRNSFEADEIANKVMLKLVTNDFKALRTFVAKHSQKAFLVFLSTITARTAMEGCDPDSQAVPLDEARLKCLPSEKRNHRESYVELIRLLRTIDAFSSRQEFKKELHTFVYALRRCAKLRAKEIAQIPFVNETSHNVENILHHIEKRAEDNAETLKKLQELRDLLEQ